MKKKCYSCNHFHICIIRKDKSFWDKLSLYLYGEHASKIGTSGHKCALWEKLRGDKNV